MASLLAPNFLLKIMPHVDGTPRICELVEYELTDVNLEGAWTGPAASDVVVACTSAARRITGPGNRIRHAHHRRSDLAAWQSRSRLSSMSVAKENGHAFEGQDCRDYWRGERHRQGDRHRLPSSRVRSVAIADLDLKRGRVRPRARARQRRHAYNGCRHGCDPGRPGRGRHGAKSIRAYRRHRRSWSATPGFRSSHRSTSSSSPSGRSCSRSISTAHFSPTPIGAAPDAQPGTRRRHHLHGLGRTRRRRSKLKGTLRHGKARPRRPCAKVVAKEGAEHGVAQT